MNTKKRTFTKGEKNVIRIMVVVSILAIGIFAWRWYSNDYYRAETLAKRAMKGTAEIEVVQEENYFVFRDKEEQSKKGIVFYPGGKVEETAYAPLLLEFAERGYEVYLVQMPAKLAILDLNAAEDILQKAEHIQEWTMMGHSLGGAMAASFTANHEEEIDNLVLLAAYSTENLRDTDIEVFSFYGTEDKVLNMEKYELYYSNLPEDVIEEVIEGANHANYGDYGAQEGDGEATITREEQRECVLDIFMSAQEKE